MYINRKSLANLRKQYPSGTRVRLIKMDDVKAPPYGTEGSVILVDEIGSIHVQWDNGSTLAVVYGEDICEKIK